MANGEAGTGRGWAVRCEAKLQGEIFKSCGAAGRKGQQKGDGERGNTFELKTNPKPGRAIERFVIKQNTQRDTEGETENERERERMRVKL